MRGLWDSRNKDRHGQTQAAQHAIRHDRLLQSIRTLYADAPHMLAADRNVLGVSLTTMMAKPPAELALWLQRTRPIVCRSKEDATVALNCTHAQITQLFRFLQKNKAVDTLWTILPPSSPTHSLTPII
jgi:hypothetical protein